MLLKRNIFMVTKDGSNLMESFYNIKELENDWRLAI